MSRAAALLANPRPTKSAQTLGDVLGREYPGACPAPCRFLPIVVSTSAHRPATGFTRLLFHNASPGHRDVHTGDPLLERPVAKCPTITPTCISTRAMDLFGGRTQFVIPCGKRQSEVKQKPKLDPPTAP